MSLIYVFVYGTLKPGEVNEWVYRDYRVTTAPAIAQGTLYHLPFGYPALTAGSDRIFGVLLTFDSLPILDVLDEFEQHNPAAVQRLVPGCRPEDFCYRRQSIPVLDASGNPWGEAWAYTMTQSQVEPLGGIRVPHGVWRGDLTFDGKQND